MTEEFERAQGIAAQAFSRMLGASCTITDEDRIVAVGQAMAQVLDEAARP